PGGARACVLLFPPRAPAGPPPPPPFLFCRPERAKPRPGGEQARDVRRFQSEPRLPGRRCLTREFLSSTRSYPMFDLSPVWKWLRGSGKRRATVRKPPRPRLALETLGARIVPAVPPPCSAPTGGAAGSR